MALERLTRLRILSRRGRQIQRRRKEIDNGIENELDSLIFQRRARVHRKYLVCDDRLAQYGLQFFECWFFPFKVRIHRRVVVLDDALDKFGAIFFRVLGKMRRNFARYHLFSHVPRKGIRLHCEKVHDAFVRGLFPNGDLHADGLRREPIENALVRILE